jgi:probable HAF family extracellular repeat protein
MTPATLTVFRVPARLAVALALTAPCAVAQQAYEVTDLGTLGGTTAFAYAINGAGQVAGSSSLTGSTPLHAFRYSQGTLTDLGTLGGQQSEAFGINDSAQVVGYANTASGADHATLWNGATPTDLGTNGATNSYAYAVNNSTQIAGTAGCAPGTEPQPATAPLQCLGTATLWSGTPIAAATLPVDTTVGPTGAAGAFAIDEGGSVVGAVYYPTAQNTSPTHWIAGVPTDLAVFGFDPNFAFGINSSGVIVGSLNVYDGPLIAAYWTSPTAYILFNQPNSGAITQQAYAINDGGQVVGTGAAPSEQLAHATFWPSPTARFVDLNDTIRPQVAASNTLTEARAINATGQIAANGFVVATGDQHAYLLTPTTSAGAPTATLTATPAAVQVGQSFTLTWSSTNAWACAAGGSSANGAPWSGIVATSGSKPVAAGPLAGAVTATLSCSFGNQTSAIQQAVVNVSYAPLTVKITASPAAIVSGESTTVTWSSANATGCSASGGAPGDGWDGKTLATSGSMAVVEPIAVASALDVTFTLTCKSTKTGQSTPASTSLTVNPPMATASGGRGALDLWAVLAFGGCLLMRRNASRARRRALGTASMVR